MTHYEDLSAYAYSDVDIIRVDDGWLEYAPRYDRVNIGWLDAPHPFPEGPTPDWFPGALLSILSGPTINAMRGWHRCSFCPPGAGKSMLAAEHSAGTVWMGNSEFRVPAGPGVMFAGPSLTWHYVTVHSYRPPEAFIEAVRTYDPAWTTVPGPWIPDDPDVFSRD